MGDISQINDVAAANISEVNDVAKANISEINDQGVPASGATRWVAATQNGFIAYAANSDLTSWTSYDGFNESDSPVVNQNQGDSESIAFGKNASGADIYLATRAQQKPQDNSNAGSRIRELTISGTDVTSSGEWTNIDVDSDTGSKNVVMEILWGARSDGTAAGTWVAVGKQGSGDIFRSTDGGANWSAVDISGLSGHQSGNNNQPYINGVASDGQGNWMFAQADRIYYSTDDAASWAVSTPFDSPAPGRGQALVYTNSTWVYIYSQSSDVRIRSCAASDITDWTDTQVDASNVNHQANNGNNVKAVAAGGIVCIASEKDSVINYFTVSGKTVGTVNEVSGFTLIRGLATDGTKWVAACDDGDLYEAATTDLSSWTQRLDGFQADGSSELDFEAVCANVTYPL
tara:strand:+ start:147 stop:1355 length:1209 start_codon:yes stop_codon:yes gene_type:complete